MIIYDIKRLRFGSTFSHNIEICIYIGDQRSFFHLSFIMTEVAVTYAKTMATNRKNMLYFELSLCSSSTKAKIFKSTNFRDFMISKFSFIRWYFLCLAFFMSAHVEQYSPCVNLPHSTYEPKIQRLHFKTGSPCNFFTIKRVIALNTFNMAAIFFY